MDEWRNSAVHNSNNWHEIAYRVLHVSLFTVGLISRISLASSATVHLLLPPTSLTTSADFFDYLRLLLCLILLIYLSSFFGDVVLFLCLLLVHLLLPLTSLATSSSSSVFFWLIFIFLTLLSLRLLLPLTSLATVSVLTRPYFMHISHSPSGDKCSHVIDYAG